MWLQSPPPVTDRWIVHVAASPHQVDDVLADLCVHKRARPIGDPDYPAYLVARETPAEPPVWMNVVRDELERRGYPTLWCEPDCAHHGWPPRPATPSLRDVRAPDASAAGRPAAVHHRQGTSPRWPARSPRRHRSGAAAVDLITCTTARAFAPSNTARHRPSAASGLA